MEFEKVVYKRRSVRAFKEKTASWKDVLTAIDAALQAPFAGNNNHLHFIVVEDEKKIKQLAVDCDQEFIQESGIVVVVVSSYRNLEHMYGDRAMVYGRQQAGAAIQNFLLSITDLGLSACWVGAFDEDLIRSRLATPDHMHVEAVIPVGYEKAKSKGREVKILKRKLEDAVWWNNWSVKRREFVFKEPQRHTTPVVFGEKGE